MKSGLVDGETEGVIGYFVFPFIPPELYNLFSIKLSKCTAPNNRHTQCQF